MMVKVAVAFIGGLTFLVVLAAIALIAAIPVYFLWNWLMPTIFGLDSISYFQAWGMFWLASLLFKSSGSFPKE